MKNVRQANSGPSANMPPHHRAVLEQLAVPRVTVQRLKPEHMKLKPLATLPTGEPEWPRLTELYWLTASLDAAGHPFPKWIWRLLPGANLMPTLQEIEANYLFRRMKPVDALFLVHCGVRVLGFQPAQWPDIFVEEEKLTDEARDAAYDLELQISAGEIEFDAGATVLIPDGIWTVEEALLIGLILAGQCGWPLVGPLTRLLPRHWTKARINLESAALLLRPVLLSPLELAIAGAHIKGITLKDIERVISTRGARLGERSALSFSQLLGPIARSDNALHVADFYAPQMLRILQLGDSSPDHRIRTYDLLQSMQAEHRAPRVHPAKGFSHPPGFGFATNVRPQITPLASETSSGIMPLGNAARPQIATQNPAASPGSEARPGVRQISPKPPRQ